MLVEEKSAVLIILRSCQRKEKRRLHVNSAVETKNLDDSVMYDTVESGMVRDVNIRVIQEPTGWLWRLTEESGEDSLMMR